jgi:hypothetical protein
MIKQTQFSTPVPFCFTRVHCRLIKWLTSIPAPTPAQPVFPAILDAALKESPAKKRNKKSSPASDASAQCMIGLFRIWPLFGVMICTAMRS